MSIAFIQWLQILWMFLVQLSSSRLEFVLEFVILTVALLRFEILMNDLNVVTYKLLQQAITNLDMERGLVFLFIFLYHS